MAKYSVKITLDAPTGLTAEEVAEHCAIAISCWGGQYHPEDLLFSANIEAIATCRGRSVATEGYDG